MKLALFVILVSFTFANAFFFRIPSVTTPDTDESLSYVCSYFIAFFAHFDLKTPAQLLQCFDKKSSDLYFKHLAAINTLVQDAENRQRVKVHLDFAKIALIDKGLSSVYHCITQTQDYQDLLQALNIKDASPENIALSTFIYYQANFGKLAGELPQVIGALNNNNLTQAGDLAAGVLSTSVSEVNTQGVALLAVNGLQNGVHIALGLPDAGSVSSCWNNETADLRLQFIYGLSVAVANGAKNNAAYNTENWYEQSGKALINKIPESTWQCWGGSDDVKAENEKLKIDISSDEFHQRGIKFVHSHQDAYWHIQKTIKESLEQHNFIHAGSAYGHLMQAIAATN